MYAAAHACTFHVYLHVHFLYTISYLRWLYVRLLHETIGAQIRGSKISVGSSFAYHVYDLHSSRETGNRMSVAAMLDWPVLLINIYL